jgi:Cu2+-containing amine oxidase
MPRADGRGGTSHPLDPLSADEIRRAVAVLRRERGIRAGWRFASVELREPPKRQLQAPARPLGLPAPACY